MIYDAEVTFNVDQIVRDYGPTVWAAAQRAQLSRTASIVIFVLMDTSARWFAILENLVSRLASQEEIGDTG